MPRTRIDEEEARELCRTVGVPFEEMERDFKAANDVGYYHGRDAYDWFLGCVQEWLCQAAEEHGAFLYDIRYGTAS